MGKTAVVIALVAAHPAETTPPRHAEDARTLARIVAHPAAPSKTLVTFDAKTKKTVSRPNPAWEAWAPPPTLARRVAFKATVVLTSVSLIGQWEDEFRRHAPSLRVRRFHSSGAADEKRLDDYQTTSPEFCGAP